MSQEIRQELFSLQPKFKPKSPEPQIKETKSKHSAIPIQEDDFQIRGVDVWSEHVPEIDPIQQLENDFNKTVEKGFAQAFCPRCKSNPCVCRIEDEN